MQHSSALSTVDLNNQRICSVSNITQPPPSSVATVHQTMICNVIVISYSVAYRGVFYSTVFVTKPKNTLHWLRSATHIGPSLDIIKVYQLQEIIPVPNWHCSTS